mmetsp:Transcript_19332/g.32918  ORF Transcript_19332/g.32918 Transcript_19332/m.32918 type:complete len:147 (-) Transcript_19332:93-533(-)
MGQIDDEEKAFMVFDKDTGKVYDLRNDKHMERLTDIATASIKSEVFSFEEQEEELEPRESSRGTTSTYWKDWWREKKQNNQDYIYAADSGNLDKLLMLLDQNVMKDKVCDLNAKGLDQWGALHFASKSGHFHIVQELVQRAGIELE